METYISIHNSTEHDGSIAIARGDDLTMYLSERIDRKKHSNNFEALQTFLWEHNNIDTNQYKKEFKIQPNQDMHHHLAHAACSFFCSPFEEADILIVDGMGPYKDGMQMSTSMWKGRGKELRMTDANPEPLFSYNSLGHYYSAVTYYCGFDVWEEGKTMGLAPYGRKKSRTARNIKKSLKLLDNGQYTTNEEFIGYCFSLKYPDEKLFGKYIHNSDFYENKFSKMFGPRRKYGEQLQDHHEDLAYGAQEALEKTLLHIIENFQKQTQGRNLCLGGGVALNSVANRRVRDANFYRNIFIPTVCGDDGQALGKLLYQKHVRDKHPRFWYLQHAFYGPRYSSTIIEEALELFNAKVSFKKYSKDNLINKTTQLLLNGKIIGWFQGRSEIGPRALGHRSILADPRNADMKDIINLRIKHRESFRPFAPSVLEEDASRYFNLTDASPFMLYVCKAKPIAMEEMPAVVHVDGTARIHTVTKAHGGIYYDLIKHFSKKTGVPALLNTSFNDNGEPLVETPQGAIGSFLRMDLDALVLGSYLIFKV